MSLPIFHCRRKNSEGRGGADKEKRSRWLRRLELEYAIGKTVRSGGHQDRATSYRHGNRPRHTRTAIIIMATPGMRAEAPASGKQGCPEWHAEETGEKQMRRTKGAFRSGDGGIRCAGEEGGRRRRTGKMRGAKQQRGGVEEVLVPVECCRASRAEAEASSPSKRKPLTHTLYSHLRSPAPVAPLPFLSLGVFTTTVPTTHRLIIGPFRHCVSVVLFFYLTPPAIHHQTHCTYIIYNHPSTKHTFIVHTLTHTDCPCRSHQHEHTYLIFFALWCCRGGFCLDY